MAALYTSCVTLLTTWAPYVNLNITPVTDNERDNGLRYESPPVFRNLTL